MICGCTFVIFGNDYFLPKHLGDIGKLFRTRLENCTHDQMDNGTNQRRHNMNVSLPHLLGKYNGDGCVTTHPFGKPTH